jgi:hypothetical protein
MYRPRIYTAFFCIIIMLGLMSCQIQARLFRQSVQSPDPHADTEEMVRGKETLQGTYQRKRSLGRQEGPQLSGILLMEEHQWGFWLGDQYIDTSSYGGTLLKERGLKVLKVDPRGVLFQSLSSQKKRFVPVGKTLRF